MNSVKNLLLGISRKKTLEDLRYCEENINKLEDRISSVTEKIHKNEENISVLKEEKESIINKIDDFEDLGISKSNLLKIEIYKEEYRKLEKNIIKITQDIENLGYKEISDFILNIKKSIEAIVGKRDEEKKYLRSLEKSVEKIKSNENILKKIQTLNVEDIKSEISTLENKLKHLNSDLNLLEEKLKNIRLEIVNNAKLIGCTLTKAMMIPKALLGNPPDVIIIDEFSMVGLPLIAFVSCMTKTQLIFVGDYKQLPPIFMSDTKTNPGKIVKEIQGRNIYNYLFGEDPSTLPETVTQLKIQFRMNDDIKEVINKLFYKGVLRSEMKFVKDNYIKLPFLKDDSESVVLIDTTNINPWVSREKNAKTGSRVNFYSALLSHRIVRNILDNNLVEKIGYTSPYAGQCRLMNHILGDDKGKVLAATVHNVKYPFCWTT